MARVAILSRPPPLLYAVVMSTDPAGASQLDTAHARLCPSCKYDLRGLTLPSRCPECGREVRSPGELRAPERFAWGLALKCGFLGLLLGPGGLIAGLTCDWQGPAVLVPIPLAVGFFVGESVRSIKHAIRCACICGLGAAVGTGVLTGALALRSSSGMEELERAMAVGFTVIAGVLLALLFGLPAIIGSLLARRS